jgi:hypothetical protein
MTAQSKAMNKATNRSDFFIIANFIAKYQKIFATK